MAANSVTGVGLGDSKGKYKAELHCGGCSCGCHGKDCERKPEPKKKPCYITYRSGNNGPTVRQGGHVRVRGC